MKEYAKLQKTIKLADEVSYLIDSYPDEVTAIVVDDGNLPDKGKCFPIKRSERLFLSHVPLCDNLYEAMSWFQ